MALLSLLLMPFLPIRDIHQERLRDELGLARAGNDEPRIQPEHFHFETHAPTHYTGPFIVTYAQSVSECGAGRLLCA